MQHQAIAIDVTVDRRTLRHLADGEMDGIELHVADTVHLVGDMSGPMPVVLAIVAYASDAGFDVVVLHRSPFTIVSLYPGGAARD